MRFFAQAAVLIGVTALATGVALLVGAADLGTALGVGQIAFVLTLVGLLLRG